MTSEDEKRLAGEAAAELVEDGMLVGLGTGSTVAYFLAALARRGLAPGPAETARQFCARAGRSAPGWAEPLARLTAQYERTRFGAAALSAAELAELDRCVSLLARRRS